MDRTEILTTYSAFTGPMFRFLVGPDEQEFLVHNALVAKASHVFDRLMNGPMAESTQSAATLPEVDAETFTYFLTHIYASIPPCGPANSVEISNSLHEHIFYSRIIEALLAKDKKEFKCKICTAKTRLKFSTSFPCCAGCDKTRKTDVSWRNSCVLPHCGEIGQRVNGLFCYSCWNDLRWNTTLSVNDAAKPWIHVQSNLREVTNFRFDIPMRALDVAEAMTEQLSTLCLSPPDLLAIGKLAIFCDMYQVENLWKTMLVALYRKLATAPREPDDLDTFIKLASIVYNGTPPPPPNVPYEEKHVLRRLISEYIAAHLLLFVAPPYLARITDIGDEIMPDILVATARNDNPSPV